MPCLTNLVPSVRFIPIWHRLRRSDLGEISRSACLWKVIRVDQSYLFWHLVSIDLVFGYFIVGLGGRKGALVCVDG